MSKILAFADIHLGIKSYSTYNDNGVSSAEEECRKSLDFILERCKKDDITYIICCGDFFHTNHPTSSNIEWTINWLYKMDDLGKPFFIITGNHDTSMYSNSMAFVKELNLKNTILLDDAVISVNFPFLFEDWKIIYAPYTPNKSLKDKDSIVYTNTQSCFEDINSNTIIVTHLHEREALLGSEAVMLSKAVDNLEVPAKTFAHKVILLTGHIHRHQIYTKSNGVTVVYPGSTTYMNVDDLNMAKGYVLIDEVGSISFEPIVGIRFFVKYDVESLAELETKRIPSNSVVFINYESEYFEEDKVIEYLKSKGCVLGWAKRLVKNKIESVGITEQNQNISNYDRLNNLINKIGEEKKLDKIIIDSAFRKGVSQIENYRGVEDED